MKTIRKLFLLPLVTILSSCVVLDYNPFQEDEYVPIGSETESIVRGLNDEEAVVIEDGFDRIDNYITGQKLRVEEREYYASYFGDYAPDGAGEIDSSTTVLDARKTYNNNVKVRVYNETSGLLNDIIDVTNKTEETRWTYLPTAATYEIRRSLSVNDEEAVVSTFDTGPYNETLDYQTRFGYGVGAVSEANYNNALHVGVNADDTIIAIDRTSSPVQFSLARNGFVQVVINVVSETKFVLYEPEDSDNPLYLPIQYREYTDFRAVSEIYHDGQVLKYLDQSIIIGYSEFIYEWSTTDNGDYDIASIPDLSDV